MYIHIKENEVRLDSGPVGRPSSLFLSSPQTSSQFGCTHLWKCTDRYPKSLMYQWKVILG